MISEQERHHMDNTQADSPKSVETVTEHTDFQHIAKWRADEGQRVVLFDLDDTLFDSGRAREARWERALRKLVPVTNQDPRTLLAAHKAIYLCHAYITGKVGARGHIFEDIRQEWNTRISYALLIAWCRDSNFPRGQTSEAAHFGALQRLKASDHWQSFLDKAEEIGDPWSVEFTAQIDRARSEFWGDFSSYVFQGVIDGLQELRNKGIRYCIVTEGHLPTQWRKVCAARLDKWFTFHQLLATSQAAQPSREMRALSGLIAWYRGREAASQEAAQMLSRDMLSDSERRTVDAREELRLDADAASGIASGLEGIKKLFEHLAKKLYEVQANGKTQTHPEFYSRVIYAISQDIDEPQDRLRKWDLSWSGRPLRLAMIGDNPQNDVEPVLELARKLDKKIMSIWVKQGRRGREGKVQAVPGRQHLECASIKDAFEKYLLNDEVWREQTDILERPAAIFGSAIPLSDPEHPLLLQTSVADLLAGVAGARKAAAPDSQMVKIASEFVEGVFASIVLDIKGSSTKDEVVNAALTLIESGDMRRMRLHSKIPDLPKVEVEFALSFIGPADDEVRYCQHLAKLAELLDAPGVWASALVSELRKRYDALKHIMNDLTLRNLYVDKLGRLISSPNTPEGFPSKEARGLYLYFAGGQTG